MTRTRHAAGAEVTVTEDWYEGDPEDQRFEVDPTGSSGPSKFVESVFRIKYRNEDFYHGAKYVYEPELQLAAMIRSVERRFEPYFESRFGADGQRIYRNIGAPILEEVFGSRPDALPTWMFGIPLGYAVLPIYMAGMTAALGGSDLAAQSAYWAALAAARLWFTFAAHDRDRWGAAMTVSLAGIVGAILLAQTVAFGISFMLLCTLWFVIAHAGFNFLFGPSFHPARERSDRSARARKTSSARNVSSTRRPPSSVRGDSPKLWASYLLLALSALILLCFFFPWLNQWITGQYTGVHLSIQPAIAGGDFYTYTRGALGLFDYGANPYTDSEIYNLIQRGFLGTSHPNPVYDSHFQEANFGPAEYEWSKGVMMPPFVLMILYPLVKGVSYTLALNMWTLGSLATYAGTISLWWTSLRPEPNRFRRWTAALFVTALFLSLGRPILVSLRMGQVDALYFLPIAIAAYVWAFHSNRRFSPIVVGGLIAFATAVKLFPGLLFGYFIWGGYREWRSLPTKSRFSSKGIWRIPEWRSVTVGLAVTAGLFLLMGSVAGWDVFFAWLRKLPLLQGDALFAHVKPSLATYLAYLPVWLSGPFEPMTGGLRHFVYPLLAIGTILWIVKTWPNSETEKTRPLALALLIAALPTLFSHWWDYLNIVMILPLIVTFVRARELRAGALRTFLVASTVAAFVLMFSGLHEEFLFKHFEGIWNWLNNADGIQTALRQAAKDPSLVAGWHESARRSLTIAIKGRTASLSNVLFGYPGSALLMIATGLTLRAHQNQNERRRVAPSLPVDPGRRLFLEFLGAGAAIAGLSFVGALLIDALGRRRIAQSKLIEIPDDPSSSETPPAFEAAMSEGQAVISDLIPTSLFVELIGILNPAFRKQIEERGPAALEDPKIRRSPPELYDGFQGGLTKVEYGDWFVRHQPIPAWRYRGQPGGFLRAFDRLAQAHRTPVRRLDEPFEHWRQRFASTWHFQQAIRCAMRGDVETALTHIEKHRDELLENERFRKKAVTAERVQIQLRKDTKPTLLFVQQPSCAGLLSYRDLVNTRVRLDTEQALGYLVEELIRRARMGRTKNSADALVFAREGLARLQSRGVVSWFRANEANLKRPGPDLSTLFKSLAESGILRADEIQMDNLLDE
jgi:glycosyl transferase family 87